MYICIYVYMYISLSPRCHPTVIPRRLITAGPRPECSPPGAAFKPVFLNTPNLPRKSLSLSLSLSLPVSLSLSLPTHSLLVCRVCFVNTIHLGVWWC